MLKIAQGDALQGLGLAARVRGADGTIHGFRAAARGADAFRDPRGVGEVGRVGPQRSGGSASGSEHHLNGGGYFRWGAWGNFQVCRNKPTNWCM